jgi:hypothetical protein
MGTKSKSKYRKFFHKQNSKIENIVGLINEKMIEN